MVLIIFACVMIQLIYENTELRELVTSGKSSRYGNLAKQRMVMAQMRGFCSLLSVIDNMGELSCYTYLKYSCDTVESSVSFTAPNTTYQLIFTEGPDSSITITDFKTTESYEAK